MPTASQLFELGRVFKEVLQEHTMLGEDFLGICNLAPDPGLFALAGGRPHLAVGLILLQHVPDHGEQLACAGGNGYGMTLGPKEP